MDISARRPEWIGDVKNGAFYMAFIVILFLFLLFIFGGFYAPFTIPRRHREFKTNKKREIDAYVASMKQRGTIIKPETYKSAEAEVWRQIYVYPWIHLGVSIGLIILAYKTSPV